LRAIWLPHGCAPTSAVLSKMPLATA